MKRKADMPVRFIKGSPLTVSRSPSPREGGHPFPVE
jgi:hypothetical protein